MTSGVAQVINIRPTCVICIC